MSLLAAAPVRRTRPAPPRRGRYAPSVFLNQATSFLFTEGNKGNEGGNFLVALAELARNLQSPTTRGRRQGQGQEAPIAMVDEIRLTEGQITRGRPFFLPAPPT